MILDLVSRGSVSNFKAIYGNDGDSALAEIGYGTGKVIYIGEDYYSFGYATNWGEGTHSKGSYTDSYQWAKEILPRALEASGAGSTPTPPGGGLSNLHRRLFFWAPESLWSSITGEQGVNNSFGGRSNSLFLDE